MPHLPSSRIFALYLAAASLSGPSACSDCDAGQRNDGRKEAVGIILEPAGHGRALEMSVLVEPAADPDRYVPPLASAANRAMQGCAALANRGEALRRGVKLELALQQSRFSPASPAPSDPLAACLAQKLAGSELKEMGSAPRRITLIIRRAALSETGKAP